MKSNLQSRSIGKLVAIAIITAAASTSVALADINGDTTIAVKFNNSGTGFSSTSVAGPNGSTLGTPNIRTSNWNITNAVTAGVAISNLNEDTSGTAAASGASLSLAGSGSAAYTGNYDGFGSPFGNSDGALAVGGLQTTSQISVSGLGSEFTTNGYDLYIYAQQGNNGWSSTFTLNSGGSGSGTALQPNSASTQWVIGQNAVEFTGLTASSFSFTPTANVNVAISGFEIVALPASAPEPATYAMLLGGLVALGFCVRRRQSRI